MSKRSVSQFFKGSSHNYNVPFPSSLQLPWMINNYCLFFFGSVCMYSIWCV